MIKNVPLDLDDMDKRLNSWLAKVEDCYKKEVEMSMNNFRREIGIEVEESSK